MKVGILTYHRALNYGAFLQAVCLCERLNAEKDISAEIIDFDMLSAQNAYKQITRKTVRKQIKILLHTLQGKKPTWKFDNSEAFVRGREKAKELLSAESLVSDDVDAFKAFVKDKYDVIISGSDEIWKIKQERGFPNPYFLPDDLGCRKLSYAASARMDFNILPSEQHKKLKEYLNDYEFISVRDKMTYESVKKEGIPEEKLMLSCDPSFLYDFPETDITAYELLKGKCRLDPKKKVLVLAEVHRKIAENIVSAVKDKYNIISTAVKIPKCINIVDLDPFEWRLLISKADMVVTSLFHGACFSVANNTPFIAVVMEDRKSKLKELLCDTELEDRYVEENDVLTIDWKKKFADVSEKTDCRDFVLQKRENFDVFLEKLRG